MTRKHVDIIIGKMANKPGAGIILLKRVRTLVRYALALGWINRDPTAGARSYRSKEIHTWNEEEIETFEKRWAEGTRERLAFALLLYTGQRGSDVHRMLWADYTSGSIRVAQQKTATKLTIPVHESLAGLLAKAKRHHPTILATQFKKPFSVKGFGNMMSNAIDEAGLPSRCKPHGLKKPLLDVLPRQVVQRARSCRSPDTRLSLRSSVTRAPPNRSGSRGEPSKGNRKIKVANLAQRKWQTRMGLLKLLSGSAGTTSNGADKAEWRKGHQNGWEAYRSV